MLIFADNIAGHGIGKHNLIRIQRVVKISFTSDFLFEKAEIRAEKESLKTLPSAYFEEAPGDSELVVTLRDAQYDLRLELHYCVYEDCDCIKTKEQVYQEAERLTLAFIDTLPELKRVLYTDIQAMFDNDPAAPNYGEVIFCYPVVNAMTHYRIAHRLHELKVPVIPRIITEQAHSKTGIDIHPGATIGEYFAIDHGTGVVIGETSIIGNHVTLYQGVTLGAKSFKYDADGNMLNVPRHPIIEDHVTIYSNASVLGRITIGHHSTIGGNIWLTHDVPPYSRILQSKAVDASYEGGLGI